jgi:hypothetical protein
MTRMDDVHEQILIKNTWKNFFGFWYGVHYALGSATILLSTLVASQPKAFGLSADGYNLLSWLLAALTALFTFFGPADRGDKYRRAWSLLNSQLTRYKVDNSYTVNHVLDAYNEGEAIIHQGTVATPPAKGS